MHWDHEPDWTIPCCICNTNLSERFRRFMQSPLLLLRMHWDQVPDWVRPSPSWHGRERMAEGRAFVALTLAAPEAPPRRERLRPRSRERSGPLVKPAFCSGHRTRIWLKEQ